MVEHSVFTKEKELIKISNSNFVDLEKVLSFIESRLWDLVTYFSTKECPHGCNLLRFAKVNFESGCSNIYLECPVCTWEEDILENEAINTPGVRGLISKKELKKILEKNKKIQVDEW